MRKRTQQLSSTCAEVQGSLFLPEQIQKVFLGKNLRQSAADYRIPPGMTLKEECSRSFRIALASWKRYDAEVARKDVSASGKRQFTLDFAKAFFSQALDFSLTQKEPAEIEDRRYPIPFELTAREPPSGRLPLVVVPPLASLDDPLPEFAVEGGGSLKKSGFSLAQEFLNASPDHRWGFVFNGDRLRLLRDAMSLTRPSYLEFNLREIFANADYAEFLHLWYALHGSRAMLKDNVTAWETWVKAGEETGEPAREKLSQNVKAALLLLGNGFLQRPENIELISAFRSGELDAKGYLHELLRLMYRFLFVFCLEERELLNVSDGTALSTLAKERYQQGYALHRFRDLALKSRFQNEYTDAWESVKIVFKGLDQGEPRLALPALGGLFKKDECRYLDKSVLANKVFFETMYLLRWSSVDKTFAPIDYKNMGTEELGGIYENLLEIVPQYDEERNHFGFAGEAELSSDRKASGSYYTPDALVQNLIKTALDPVIERKLKEHPDAPSAALLSIRVIDPSCGSGHFLLAAARRIAERLASVYSHGEAVSPELYRRTLREVIQHCIYGVDLNPLAIELSKMGLWLEGFAEGMPLSFLDHHLKVGNALLGISETSVLYKGIPDKAYTSQRGDDKAVCTEAKKRNKKELQAFHKTLESLGPNLFSENERPDLLERLENSPSSTLADEQKKEALYREFQQSGQFDDIRKACDLWVGAFLCPKKQEVADKIPTNATLGRVLADPDGLIEDDLKQIVYAEEACRVQNAFHWPLKFPLVFGEDGGFDCVLSNPPWEKAKLEDKKWFAIRLPEIASDKYTAAKRKKLIAALAKGQYAEDFLKVAATETQKNKERALYAQYEEAQRQNDAMATFCHLTEHEGGRFPLTGTGDTNLFAYFSELVFWLKRSNGHAGMVVPTGLITDSATQQMARTLFNGEVASIYHFNNTEKIFPIDSRYSFILLTMAESAEIDCVFYATNLGHLEDKRRHVIFQKGDLSLFNPNTKTCVLVRTEADLKLCRKIYQHSSVFIKDSEECRNPWHADFMRMFDMTNDSGLFHEIKDEEDLVPLYEGKLFHQFDSRWATYEEGKTREVTEKEKADPKFAITPKYWVACSEVGAKFQAKGWKEKWTLAFRDIAIATNERTFIVTVLPAKYGAGNKAPLIMPKASPENVACLLANLNSLIVDFIERIKQSSVSVNLFYVKQLPILSPAQYREKDVKYIAERVAQLTRNSDDIRAFWLTDYPNYDYQGKKTRLKIRAELDAYFAKLYGLTREELAYILDPEEVKGPGWPSVTFPGLKRNEIAEYGEYLTQRLVLEAFDELDDMEPAKKVSEC